MRLVFLSSLLAGALFYTYHGFQLSFLTRTGRMGPGFLPQFVGVLLIAVILYSLVLELKTRKSAPSLESSSEGDAEEVSQDAEPGVSPDLRWRDTLVMMFLAGLFVWALPLLGGVMAMGLFIFVTLSVFNRGKLLKNVLVSLAVPAFIYGLFSVWLNSPIPEGLLLRR